MNQHTQQPLAVVVMGVRGSGKATIGGDWPVRWVRAFLKAMISIRLKIDGKWSPGSR